MPEQQSTNATANILIVDDTPENLQLLAQILREHDYQVRLLREGSMVLPSVRHTPPDVILLDILMPGLDGYAVCAQLKADARTRAIPVIFISALSEITDKVRGFRMGGVDYITKPFQVEEVLARVKAHVLIQQQQRQLQAQNAQLQAEMAERLRAEEARRQSEQRYRDIVNNANEAIVVIQDGRFRFVNPQMAEFSGYAEAELLGQPFEEFFLFEERVAAVERYHRRIGGEPLPPLREFRARDKQGRIKWVQNNSIIIQWEGRPAMLNFLSDITERKQVEEALRESEARFRGMFEHHSAIMYLLDPDTGRIIYANPAAAQFYGYPVAEFQQMTMAQIGAASPEKISHAMQAAKRQQWKMSHFRHRLADGQFRDVEIHTAPIMFEGQTVLFSIVHDITDRKQAEEALRASEQRYRLLAENAMDVIWTLDLRGRFTYVSPSVKRLRGYTADEVMQQTLAEVLTPASAAIAGAGLQQVYAAIKAGQQNISPRRDELEQFCKDGTTVWTESITSLMHDDAGQFVGFLGVTRDITARKQMELELLAAKDAADAANRAKSTFLANMSHELRTPLNGILGYAQILGADPTLADKHRDNVAIIERSGHHLLSLINDILDLAKVEAGKVELAQDDFELAAQLREVSNLIRIRVEGKGLAFRLDVAPDLPRAVHSDAHRLRQVLLNLLGNAVKFTERGTVTLRVTIPLLGGAGGGLPRFEGAQGTPGELTPAPSQAEKMARIRFEIEDTGIGIVPEELDNIFEPFQQTGAQQYRRQGTGLGLAISRKLIALMGGELQVTSALGRGSTFWFELTMPVVAAASADQQRAAQRIIGLVGAAPRLLVVDDDPVNRRLVAEMLIPLGFDVREAAGGQDGWRTCLTWQPQALITDLRMPDLDGVTLIRQLRQNPACNDLVIIASSASVYVDDQQQCLAAGAQAFLPKPIELPLLLAHLHRLLRLTWRYGEAPESIESSAATAELILPPAATLETLQTFAKIGDITELRNHLTALAQADAQLIPFTDRLLELVKEFQLTEIRQMLEDALSEGNPAHTEAVLTPEALAALPAPLRCSLHEAASNLDFDQALKATAQIHPQNAPLAAALAEVVQDFRFDALQTLFEQAARVLPKPE